MTRGLDRRRLLLSGAGLAMVGLVNRNGVVAARAIVSHRMPEGTVYMHHAQDRLIDVPLTEQLIVEFYSK